MSMQGRVGCTHVRVGDLDVCGHHPEVCVPVQTQRHQPQGQRGGTGCHGDTGKHLEIIEEIIWKTKNDQKQGNLFNYFNVRTDCPAFDHSLRYLDKSRCICIQNTFSSQTCD